MVHDGFDAVGNVGQITRVYKDVASKEIEKSA